MNTKDVKIEFLYPKEGMLVGLGKGVRVTHIPSNTVVEYDKDRNQYVNKEMAMMELKKIIGE